MTYAQFIPLVSEIIEPKFDLGQVFIGTSMWVAVWFIKKEINTIGKRLDLHEKNLFMMAQELSKVIGIVSVWNGRNRRRVE